MKKFLFLCCLLQISISGLAHDFEVDGIYYNITSSEEATVAVTYEGSYISWSDEYTGDVVINDIVEFDGTTYSVTSIGDSAFSGCTGLTSVTIPESVASIGGWAFSGCSGLTSVTIPESLTSIGNCAFQGCTSLTSVTIPESLTSIGYSAFSGTAWYDNQPDGVVYAGKVAYTYKGTMGANTEMVLAEGTVVIAEYAFRFQTALKSVIIPNSVTSIGNSAFANCKGLTSVTIGNSVSEIGESAFANCSGLESIVVENGNPVYNSYNNCNAIIETSSNTLILGCKTTVIPNSVTSIGGSAFSGCTGLASVTIPNSVTSIGKYAFASCYALTSINIPNSVTSIGIWAFGECSGLTSIVVESGNVNFDSRDGCNAIIATSTNTLITGCKNTIIPNSVTAIGEGAFCGCSGLTSISIPSSVTSIGSEAFEFCRSLTSITIPESVTSIGNHAFYDTSWYDNQPDGLVYAGKVAYKYKGTMPTNTSIVLENGTIGIAESAFSDCEGLTSITIPNSVTCIEMYAFYNCKSLTSVTIGNSVTSIGTAAFAVCYALTSINIPESVTSIGKSAFSSCRALTSITIPKNVTSIGGRAFARCIGMKEIYCLSKETPEVGNDTFEEMDVNNVLLIVPEHAVEKYKAHPIWGQFTIKMTTGVHLFRTEDRSVGSAYDLNGRHQTKVQRGLNIVRMDDGTTKKVMVK